MRNLPFWWLCAFAAIVLLAGCATIPIAETKAFSDSVKALDTAGGQLLSDLAVAERRIGKTRAIARSQSSIIRSKSGAVLTRLNPSDAPYFATIGDPPAVNIFRHAFKTIVVYADTLIALSDGSDAAAVQGQISEFAKVVDTLGTALAFLPAPIPGVAALIPIVNEGLKPVIAQILLEQNRENAQALVLSTAPAMRDLMTALRNAAPVLLEALTTDAVAALAAAAKARQKDEKPATVAALYVTQVANYVVLLDKGCLAGDNLRRRLGLRLRADCSFRRWWQ